MASSDLTLTVDDLLARAVQDNTAFFTGRQIITFRDGDHAAAISSLRVSESSRVARSEDFKDVIDFSALGTADYVLFEQLGVALASGAPETQDALASLAAADAADSRIAAIEPETFVFPTEGEALEYLRGFSAAVDRIRQDLAPAAADQAVSGPEPEAALAAVTWGLVATRVPASAFSGRGIKAAVLDTGLDLRHPDFHGRAIVSQSFISGQPVQDGHGHGTHTCGTACGPKAPAGVPRYGIGFESQIFIGKVLSNTGGGTSATVLAGMNWAIANRCQVISMSLGGPGGPFAYYTQAGQRALDVGSLIIAATGNDSRRPGHIAPTGAPANSPTIMAVAALDQNLRPAVFSSVPMPARYGTKSGTSMATPHVSGCAALWAQSNPAYRGRRLWDVLVRSARRLRFPPTDVGAGLVQAP